MKDQPPAIIQKIEWLKVYGSKYLLHICLVILAVYAWDIRKESNYRGEVISSLQLSVEDYEGCRTESPDGDPPLRVTFTDDSVAFVNFFHLAVPPYSPQWQQTWMSTYEQFSSSLKAAVYSQLELVTLEYARTHRDELVQRIVTRIEPVLTILDLEMSQFDLLEFCEVREPALPPMG